MKILLTGPTSFSGKIILNKLINRGYEITTLSRSQQNSPSSVHGIYGDLVKIDYLEGNFDAVVHIAATSPQAGITASQLVHDNILATQNLIHLAKACAVKKFIFFSSCSVYGEITQTILNESTPSFNPDVYGVSKLMCESLLREQTSFNALAIRLPAIIGKEAARHWLANCISKALLGDDIIIYNPHALFNNAIHINTLATFIDQLLQDKLYHNFDCVNVASLAGLSIKKIIEKIHIKLKSKSKIIVGKTQKNPFIISSNYAIDKYGFIPKLFVDELNTYLNDYVETRLIHKVE